MLSFFIWFTWSIMIILFILTQVHRNLFFHFISCECFSIGSSRWWLYYLYFFLRPTSFYTAIIYQWVILNRILPSINRRWLLKYCLFRCIAKRLSSFIQRHCIINSTIRCIVKVFFFIKVRFDFPFLWLLHMFLSFIFFKPIFWVWLRTTGTSFL